MSDMFGSPVVQRRLPPGLSVCDSDRIRDYPLPENWNLEHLNGVIALNRMIDKQAEFIAYLHDFRLMTVLMLILLPLVLILRSPEKLDRTVE